MYWSASVQGLCESALARALSTGSSFREAGAWAGRVRVVREQAQLRTITWDGPVAMPGGGATSDNPWRGECLSRAAPEHYTRTPDLALPGRGGVVWQSARPSPPLETEQARLDDESLGAFHPAAGNRSNCLPRPL